MDPLRYQNAVADLQQIQEHWQYHTDWLTFDCFPSLRLGLLLSGERWPTTLPVLREYLRLGGRLLSLNGSHAGKNWDGLNELLQELGIPRELCWIELRDVADNPQEWADVIGIGWWDSSLSDRGTQALDWQALLNNSERNWETDVQLTLLEDWPEVPAMTVATEAEFRECKEKVRNSLQTMLAWEVQLNLLQQQGGSLIRLQLVRPLQKAMRNTRTIPEWQDYLANSWFPVFQHQARQLRTQAPDVAAQNRDLLRRIQQTLLELMGQFEETLRFQHALALARVLEPQSQTLPAALPPDSQLLYWLLAQPMVTRLWLPANTPDQLVGYMGLMRCGRQVPLAAMT